MSAEDEEEREELLLPRGIAPCGLPTDRWWLMRCHRGTTQRVAEHTNARVLTKRLSWKELPCINRWQPRRTKAFLGSVAFIGVAVSGAVVLRRTGLYAGAQWLGRSRTRESSGTSAVATASTGSRLVTERRDSTFTSNGVGGARIGLGMVTSLREEPPLGDSVRDLPAQRMRDPVVLVQHAVGVYNALQCPPNSTFITTEEGCKAYQETLHANIWCAGRHEGYQADCASKDVQKHDFWCIQRPMYCWQDRNGCVVFKGNGVGRPYISARPICQVIHPQEALDKKTDADASRDGASSDEEADSVNSGGGVAGTAIGSHSFVDSNGISARNASNTTTTADGARGVYRDSETFSDVNRVNGSRGRTTSSNHSNSSDGGCNRSTNGSEPNSSSTMRLSGGNPRSTMPTTIGAGGAHQDGNVTLEASASTAALPSKPNALPRRPAWLPANLVGVNFGGWLCLEDWFFSGSAGTYVDSAWPFVGQGACLPPREVSRLSSPWKSEGTLTRQLGERAARAIRAHRESFITEADFAEAAQLGIRTVRVPLTWAAFAEALAPAAPDIYGKHDPETDTAIVPDPFYKDGIAMATVPHNFLRRILDWADRHGVKVLWDIHSYMGGSSNGTYSGVWPQRPVFWYEKFAFGDTSKTLFEAGLWIAQALVNWCEGLTGTRLHALAGMSFMNEPAHLSLGQDWANEWQVIDWLTKSSDIFRKSTLPGKGVRLYVNIVETAFRNWWSGFAQVVPPWWYSSFTPEERNTWAVIDGHKYWAWDPACAGCTGGVGMCGWSCDDNINVTAGMARRCIDTWVNDFVTAFPDGLRAVSEFSAGTFRNGRLACSTPEVTQRYLEEQLASFQNQRLEPFFWTWRMPYGSPFEAGWSLKYMVGYEAKSQPYECPAPGGVLN